MIVSEPKLVGERWIVTETDGAKGEIVDYGYPTESAAKEAHLILTKKAVKYLAELV
jgi:hypothetical protein